MFFDPVDVCLVFATRKRNPVITNRDSLLCSAADAPLRSEAYLTNVDRENMLKSLS